MDAMRESFPDFTASFDICNDCLTEEATFGDFGALIKAEKERLLENAAQEMKDSVFQVLEFDNDESDEIDHEEPDETDLEEASLPDLSTENVLAYGKKTHVGEKENIFSSLSPRKLQEELRRYIMDNPDKKQILRQIAIELAPHFY